MGLYIMSQTKRQWTYYTIIYENMKALQLCFRIRKILILFVKSTLQKMLECIHISEIVGGDTYTNPLQTRFKPVRFIKPIS